MASSGSSTDACPVDHNARQAWLDQARAQGAAAPGQKPPSPTQSCDSSTLSQTTTSPPAQHPATTRFSLDQSREISTIPRALPNGGVAPTPAAPTSTTTPPPAPANNERESGASPSGNWIYPSEQMFFDAMKRKAHDPRAEDMRSIVPIHNAVNERAWAEIKAWEAGQGAEACGGPRLVSFSGDSKKLTPRARWNGLLGYTAPFDRHDWVVDRCGTKIEYVIDFYAGKDDKVPGKSLNFYLDVRPKLNSFEGWRMRAMRFAGM